MSFPLSRPLKGNGEIKAAHSRFPHRESGAARTRLKSRQNGRGQPSHQPSHTWAAKSGRPVNNKKQMSPRQTLDANYMYSTAPSGVRMSDGQVEVVAPPLPEGSMGGRFSSTTRFQPVPHQALRNTYSRRGTRLQPIYSQRYVAIPPSQQEVAGGGTTPWAVPLTLVNKSNATAARFLHANEVQGAPPRIDNPNRPPGSYMLVGNQMTPRNRHNMEQEELLQFARLGLAPAPELYFGRGFGTATKSIRLRQLQATARPNTSAGLETLPSASSPLPSRDTAEIEVMGGPATDPIPEEPSAAATSEDGDVAPEEAPPAAEEEEAPGAGATAPAEPEPAPDMGGWAGTVLDDAAPAPQAIDNELLKDADTKPEELDLYTYQLSSIFGTADDEQIGALNSLYMSMDDLGTASISPERLEMGITSQFTAAAWKQTATMLSIPASNSVSIREYIVAAIVALQVSAEGQAERFAAFGDAFSAESCERLREAFYQRDSTKTGTLALAELREVLRADHPAVADDDNRWGRYILELEKQDGVVTLLEFLVTLPSLLAPAEVVLGEEPTETPPVANAGAAAAAIGEISAEEPPSEA